jgi:hypothetical protein
MATLAETVTLVKGIIKNDSTMATSDQLNATDIDNCIDRAINEYEKDRPLIKYDSVIGNAEHEIRLPTNFVTGFSRIDKIEYPAGEQIQSFIDPNDFDVVFVDTTERTIDSASAAATEIVLSTAGDAAHFKDGEIITISDADESETNWVTADGNTSTGAVTVKNALSNTYDDTQVVKKKDHVLLKRSEPLSTEYIVIHWTAQHTLSDSVDTIYANDYRAVAYLAAAYCCYSLAATFAYKQESSIAADSVDFGTKSDEWQKRGEKFEKVYNDHIGKGADKETKAASGIADLDKSFQHGRDLLFHGRNWR